MVHTNTLITFICYYGASFLYFSYIILFVLLSLILLPGFLLVISIQMKLYKPVQISHISKCSFSDLSIWTRFSELNGGHFTCQIFWVSDRLHLLALMFFAFRGKTPLTEPPAVEKEQHNLWGKMVTLREIIITPDTGAYRV